MKKRHKIKAIKRAFLSSTLIVLLGSGVGYAVLKSQQNALTGNTISTASASLQISRDGTSYNYLLPGFDFTDIVPGGSPMPIAGQSFHLKNNGATPLALKLSIKTTPQNPDGADLSKVNVLLTTVGSGTGAQSFSLQNLISSNGSGGLDITGVNLAPGEARQYKFQVSMAADAINGSSANLSNIDFAFVGIAQSP